MEETGKFDANLEEKKKSFFYALAREVADAMMPLHREYGLRKSSTSKEDWRNVGKHSLVAVARAVELADLIGLPEKVKRELKIAVSTHDFFKRKEVELTKEKEITYELYLELDRQSLETLKKHGFSEDVLEVSQGAGVASFERMDRLIQKEDWSEKEFATAILHYVDGYTIDDGWVEPATEGLNELDRRSFRQEQNPPKRILDEDVKQKKIFGGETLHEAQRRIGHEIEKRLAKRISKVKGIDINPLEVPEFVDSQISVKIAATV